MLLKKIVGFAVHQAASTLGIIVLSGISWNETVDTLGLGRINVPNGVTNSVLLGTPGFPFQAAAGIVLGFTLARRLHVNSIGFVWILPLLWFCFGAVVVAPISTLHYLLDGGCQPARGCFYQILFTLPLIASFSYAFGGVVSMRLIKMSSRDRQPPEEANHT